MKDGVREAVFEESLSVCLSLSFNSNFTLTSRCTLGPTPTAHSPIDMPSNSIVHSLTSPSMSFFSFWLVTPLCFRFLPTIQRRKFHANMFSEIKTKEWVKKARKSDNTIIFSVALPLPLHFAPSLQLPLFLVFCFVCFLMKNSVRRWRQDRDGCKFSWLFFFYSFETDESRTDGYATKTDTCMLQFVHHYTASCTSFVVFVVWQKVPKK